MQPGCATPAGSSCTYAAFVPARHRAVTNAAVTDFAIEARPSKVDGRSSRVVLALGNLVTADIVLGKGVAIYGLERDLFCMSK